MTAEDVTRVLLDLLARLPADMRPFAGALAGSAARTMPLWTPLAVLALLAFVVAVFTFYHDLGASR